MPSRRDSSTKRLFQFFEETRPLRQLAVQFFEDDILKPAGTNVHKLFDLDSDTMRAAISRTALRLNINDKKDAALFTAFEAAGLDHRNPLHWRHLLSMFAEAHFGKAKTKPQKWDSVALLQVLQDYNKVKSENPGANVSELRKLLCTDKRFKDKYKHYNKDAFRKVLRQARSPKTNILLRHPEMKDPLLQVIRDDWEQKGVAWTPELERFIKNMAERFFNGPKFKGGT